MAITVVYAGIPDFEDTEKKKRQQIFDRGGNKIATIYRRKQVLPYGVPVSVENSLGEVLLGLRWYDDADLRRRLAEDPTGYAMYRPPSFQYIFKSDDKEARELVAVVTAEREATELEATRARVAELEAKKAARAKQLSDARAAPGGGGFQSKQARP